MMKVGIISFHRARNYGGVLQCYALQTFLVNRGYNVEIVDYRCPKIEQSYRLISFSSLKSFLASIVRLRQNSKASNLFRAFRRENLHLSRQKYYNANDFERQFDICIIGSDQVWTPRLVGGFNPVFYGNFSPSIRKIGYAVSVGEIDCYSKEERQIMADHLRNFSHFSTREESFRNELVKLSGRIVTMVLDPSLLLAKEEYDLITEDPSEDNYILYYQQEFNPETKYLIIDIAKQINANRIIVVAGKKENYDFPHNYYGLDSLSVSSFLGLIKNAKVVFTSSFHGTAYSLVFRKDFYFVDNAAPDRAVNLLKICGAQDRLVHSTDKVVFSRVNYNSIEQRMDEARIKSINYLIDAIENK